MKVYSISELDEYAGFLGDIQAAAATQNLPLDTALKECAPGQFEINLVHGSDVLKACDSAVLLKRLIKGIAVNHGFSRDVEKNTTTYCFPEIRYEGKSP